LATIALPIRLRVRRDRRVELLGLTAPSGPDPMPPDGLPDSVVTLGGATFGPAIPRATRSSPTSAPPPMRTSSH
jgi:hypothetical protein